MRSSPQAESETADDRRRELRGNPTDSARLNAATLLTDSLVHDARNPLNALSINLEVLAERLRRQAESVAPAFDKNLRVMREQILRVDAILRTFADFIAPRPAALPDGDFSQVVLKALEVVGHECRRRRLTLRPMVEAGVKVGLDGVAGSFFALQPLLRGLRRAPEGGEVTLTLKQEAGFAVLRVADGLPSDEEPLSEVVPALEALCQEQGGRVELRSGECALYLPLAP